jgi:hypothetical protein
MRFRSALQTAIHVTTTHAIMKTWPAILFTIGLAAACLVISSLTGFNLIWFLVLGTGLWAAIDSSKIQFRRYKSQIACGPLVLFVGCLFLWIVVFPWYLAMRYKIKSGIAILKEQYV